MNKTQETYNEMSRKKYEVDDKLSELMKAKDNYKDVLVNDTIGAILEIQENEGHISERTLNIFLKNLATDIKNIYDR